MCHAHQRVVITTVGGALLLRANSKDGLVDNTLYTYNYVYFSNDVASLQNSDVTESESDDCY